MLDKIFIYQVGDKPNELPVCFGLKEGDLWIYVNGELISCVREFTLTCKEGITTLHMERINYVEGTWKKEWEDIFRANVGTFTFKHIDMSDFDYCEGRFINPPLKGEAFFIDGAMHKKDFCCESEERTCDSCNGNLHYQPIYGGYLYECEDCHMQII